jgi:hypothetical protein
MLIGERELKAVEQREQGARRRPWRATGVGAGHAGPPRSLSTPPTATVVAGVREGGGPQSPPPQGHGRGVSFCRGARMAELGPDRRRRCEGELLPPGFVLPNRRGIPPPLGIGIPSGIPLNITRIQKTKTKRLYNRFVAVYRSVSVAYQ